MEFLLTLQSFVEVAKRLNMTKAAEKLFISQPALTGRIQRLENDLGVELFNRTGKTISLSSYGELFLPYALQCLEMMEEIIQKFNRERDPLRSTLSIGASNPIGTILLPHYLQSLHKAFPALNLQILRIEGYSGDIIQMVKESQIDIGFFNKSGEIKGADKNAVVIEPLFEQDFVVVARPDHPLVSYSQVADDEFSKWGFIYFSEQSAISILIHFERKQLNPAWTFKVSTLQKLIDMVKSTTMIAVLPSLLINEDLKKGDIASIPFMSTPNPLVTYLAYSKFRLNPEIVPVIKRIGNELITELNLPCRPLNS